MRCAAALLGVLAFVGCGASQITLDQADKVSAANLAFAENCLDGSHYGEMLSGVDDVIAVFRANPSAVYEHRTMRQVLADDANHLRCQPDQAQKLRDALAAG